MIHNTKKCGAKYEVYYTEDQIPYLECEGCGHKINDWIKWQNEYRDFWKNEERWASKKDHLATLLSYFAHLYEQYYGTAFTFSLNEKGLFRGTEMHHVRRMYAMFDAKVEYARAYMDWLFETKVKQRKRKITSLGFLATPTVITEFKLCLQKKLSICRDTPLPAGMLTWIQSHVPELPNHVALSDHGDLHLLLSHYKRGHLSGVPAVDAFVRKLKVSGYVDRDLAIKNWRE